MPQSTSALQREKPRRHLLNLCISAALSLAAAPTTLLAAGPEAVEQFNLPAGDLARALNAAARQGGLTLSVDPNLLEGKSVQALSGSYSLKDAIDTLLKGHGLNVRYLNDTTITLEPQAEASSSETASQMQLSTITVKGELQERSLQETVSSVAVIRAQENESNLDDVISRTANVGQDGFDDRFSIRGILYDGVGFAGEAQTISIDIDGVPVDNWAIRTGWNNLWDMEQVEIFRGPQSTSQGRNALAGAVVMRSNRPTWEHEGKVRVRAGSDDTRGLAFAAGGPLIDDSLAFRIAGESESSNGFISNPTFNDDKYGDSESKFLRGSLLWLPTQNDDLQVLTTFRYSDSRDGELDVNNDADPFDFENTSGYANASSNANKTRSLAVEVDWKFDERWSLLSTTTYNNTDYFTRTGFDTNPNNPSERSRDAEVDSYTQDLRFQFEDDQLKGVVGVYASYFDEFEQFGGTLPGAFLGLPVPPYDPASTFSIEAKAPNTETNLALYTEWEYKFKPQWTAIAGARLDHERRERTDESDTVIRPVDPFGIGGEGDPVSAKTSFTVFLPKVGVRYAFNEDITLGALVQRGYRSGGTDISLLPPFVTGKFDPEHTWNAELSFRSKLLDNRLRLDANLFYTDWTDQQVGILIDGGPLTRTVNAGASHLYGAELELSGYLDQARRLNAFLSLGLLHTRFDEFLDSDGTDYSGNEFPLSANVNLGAGLKYTHPTGYFAAVGVSHVGERESDIENSTANRVDAYTKVNMRGGYKNDDWGVTFYANNLFDEKIELYKSSTTVAPGAPRQIGLTMEYFW